MFAAYRSQVIPVRLLVVDDHEIVRMGVRILLSGNDEWEICGEAQDGAEAIQKVQELSPDVVILDLTMPVMSGEETLRQLQMVNPKVKVLLTSGYNEVEAVQRFAGKGLAGFIQKPYTAAALAEKVKEVLAG